MKKRIKHSKRIPAILGGKPMFNKPVPITMPTIPDIQRLTAEYKKVLRSGMITNSKKVCEFEEKVSGYLGVKNAVAVNSCTGGLMLIMKVLGLKGEVIVPSFTFHATAHAIAWNGLTPVFVDCDRKTFNIDPSQVERAITQKTQAILGVHIFGNPAAISQLESIAKKYGIRLLFDAAHGFGSRYKGVNIGASGDAEAFSLSPTKLLTAGEGGIVATNDDKLAKKIKVGRNYGDSGNYDCQFSGFNARMDEFSAILGIESLALLEENVGKRNELASLYRKLLGGIPGLGFQEICAGDRSSYKDFSILIDKDAFGMGRDKLSDALAAENIVTKKYFYPPVHRQAAFNKIGRVDKELVHTEYISQAALSLPLYSHMPQDYVIAICSALKGIHEFCSGVNKSLGKQRGRK